MNSTPSKLMRKIFKTGLLCLLAVQLSSLTIQAGLTLEMNVIRYDPEGYYFSPYLNTNNTAPNIPFGDYHIASLNAPTNGTYALYRFDVNGFNQIDGISWGFSDFTSMIHELTNGNWSIYATNSVTTNVYHFTVSANIASNSLPPVTIAFPVNGAINVTNQPTFIWQGPTNYNGLVVYGYNLGQDLPVTQTSLPSPNVLNQGINNFTVHYDSNSATAVVSSTPLDNALNPVSSWVSTAHLQDYVSSQFTVGTADVSGTTHTLVAHYAWDVTNADGTVSGADTSGNGYDLNFGGGFGSQGGINPTGDPAAGPYAIQFHDGDHNSAGYVGWNPMPSGVLNALAGSFSISCWIKTTQNNFGQDNDPAYNGAGIVSADNGGLANDVIPMALTGNKIGFNTGGDLQDATLNSVTSVNDGNYHLVVVTRNQETGQKIIYIDGVLDGFSSGTTNFLNDIQKLTIGSLADASDADPNDFNYYNGFDGKVDDLQIYSGVLSSSDAANLFAHPGSTVANGGGSSGGHQNVAHYTFEDGTSTFQLGVDSSPNGNNMASYSYWGPVHTNSADAETGTNAVQFFGTSSMVCFDQVLTNLNTVLAGSFTFSTWVKTTASRGNDYDNALYGNTIFWAFNDHNNTNDTIPLAITGSKAAFTTRGANPGAFDTLHSLTSVNDGNYHLITVTRNQASGEKKIYVDGNFEASQFGTTNPLNGNNYYLSIGGTTLSSYTGLLDDFQIYSGVLSAGDIASLYANPGTVVADVSGSDFNATLNTTGLTWNTGGDADWFTETSVTHDGVAAAQSGIITDNQASWIETTLPSSGQILFYWKVSSEDGADYMHFYINGNEQDSITGDADWSQESYAVSAGDIVRWEYTKDGSDSDGLDAGFLDQVKYVPTPPTTNTAPVITVNPFSQTNYPGYNVSLLAAATSNPAATWQWFKVSSGAVSGATNALYIPANSGTAGVAGNYYAVASNIIGSANTLTVTVSFATATLPPDWSRAFASPYVNTSTNVTTDINLACLLDSSGNIYTVGSITGTNYFGANALISSNGVEETSFLKQTVTGTPVWGRSITNNGHGNSYPRGIAAAPGNGFYASGFFSGTNWLGTNQLIDTGAGSTYLVRFDANGNNLWVRTITGTNSSFPTHHTLVSDSAGNVTLSALISGYTSFGSTNLTAIGQQGALAQYDPNGNVRWVQLPSAWPDYLTYNGGRIYGSMGGNSTNYVGGATNVSDRRRTLFALNPTNGQALWLRSYAAQMDQGDPSGFSDDNTMVAVSGTNIFLVGSVFGSNAVFGTFTVALSSAKGQYFARYDLNGNAQLATSFGSQFTWPWAAVADASGNVYVGGDFDTYSIFGGNIIAAPFYDTVQFIGTTDNRIPGQSFVAKFDRDGNALWARVAQSQSSYLNLRDIALDADGIWGCGFFQPVASFGTNTLFGGLPPYHLSGYLAKITDGVALALPVTLFNPSNSSGSFQLSFISQSGFAHSVQYRTNLVLGSWQTYSNVTGDGVLKTIPVPVSVFNGAKQGFIRVSTQ